MRSNSLFTLAALCVASNSFMLAGDTGSSGGTAALDNFGLPPWQCHKTVWASKIVEINTDSEIPYLICSEQPYGAAMVKPIVPVAKAWIEKHEPEVGGYFVLYENGYQSYSPADAFEDGYTPAGGDHPGELARNAYSAALNGRDAVSGKIMASWASLLASGDEEVQAVCRAWNRAARAVEARTIARLASAPTPQGIPLPDNQAHDLGALAIGRKIVSLESEFALTQDPETDALAKSLREILVTIGRQAPPAESEEYKSDMAQVDRLIGNEKPTMRARLLVTDVGPEPTSSEGQSQSISMMAVGPDGNFGEDGSDPDSTFSRWTPTANLFMRIANPWLYGKIQNGDKYHVDFTLCHREPAAKPTPADAQPGVTGDIPDPEFRGGQPQSEAKQ